MVKIRKGNLTAVVPYFTFKNHYEKLGWKARAGKNKPMQEENAILENDDIENTEITENADNEIYDNEVDLLSMNVSQLKAFAAENGIDISEANSKKEMRTIIENALNG